VGCDWDDGEKYPVICTLLRVLSGAGEHLDERQNCFTLQTAAELAVFPTNGARQQPRSVYLSTETRQELIKVETAWTKAVTASVKAVKVSWLTKSLLERGSFLEFGLVLTGNPKTVRMPL